MKYLIRPKDIINSPVPEMGKIRREMIVDSNSVGAEVLTFWICTLWTKSNWKSFWKKHSYTNAEEVAFITYGKGIALVNNQEFEVKAGDSVWILKGVMHWFHNPFDQPREMVFSYSKPSLEQAGLEVVV